MYPNNRFWEASWCLRQTSKDNSLKNWLKQTRERPEWALWVWRKGLSLSLDRMWMLNFLIQRGDRAQGLVHSTQALCRPNHITSCLGHNLCVCWSHFLKHLCSQETPSAPLFSFQSSVKTCQTVSSLFSRLSITSSFPSGLYIPARGDWWIDTSGFT